MSVISVSHIAVMPFVETARQALSCWCIDTQRLLKSMLQTLFLQIARRYRIENLKNAPLPLSEQIIQYMTDHSNVVTLKDIAEHFSYHPNCISALLHKETGRKFTEILLEKRMESAVLLLKNTTLSIEELAAMLGYSNHSNFYKAFKMYYGITPREYQHAKATQS